MCNHECLGSCGSTYCLAQQVHALSFIHGPPIAIPLEYLDLEQSKIQGSNPQIG